MVAKYRSRAEKERQAVEMLRSMGSLTATKASTTVNSEEEAAEMKKCDQKVHSAMMKMAAGIDRDLRAMGVPFYAIKHDLVILGEGKDDKPGSGRLDKGELRELQKKILQLLEELFKD